MPSFGTFVLAAIIASSICIYLINRSTALEGGFYVLYQSYYTSQKLMLVSVFVRAFSVGNMTNATNLINAFNASLSADNLAMRQENDSIIVFSRYQPIYTAMKLTKP